MKTLIRSNDRFFVAGARGMAGSAICRALKAKGYGDPTKGGKLLTPSRGELNLLNFNEVNSWFAANKPDVVILAAAKVGGIHANSTKPAEFLLENLKIQTNVIENAWMSGVRRLIFLASSCIYPKFASQPIREEELLTGALEPSNEWYAIAKISGIKLCDALRKQYDFDAFSLMPTNLYGPGDNYDKNNSHVLPALIRRFYEAKINKKEEVICWGSGSPMREFLHTDDLGSATVFCLENFEPNDLTKEINTNDEILTYLNIGTGREIAIREVAEKISKIFDYKGRINWDETKPDGTPRKLLDNTRIKALGWKPNIDLDKGILSICKNFNLEMDRL